MSENKPALPPKESIKGLPQGADIVRTANGGIAAIYRYRSKENLKLSGGRTMAHLGMIEDSVFIPSRDYQRMPENFPIPVKQMRGRRVSMLMNKPEQTVENQTPQPSSEVKHPLNDSNKSCSFSAGASQAVLASGAKAGILKALYTALAKTFGPKAFNVDKLYKQVLTCAMHTAITGDADRHLESFCEAYATPCRMTSQVASELYALLGTHINELRQNFFEETVKLIEKNDQLTIDGTYYNCEGKRISYAQIGLSKDKTYRRQISQLIVYSTKAGLPILYMTNPGNMHDSHTLKGIRELCARFDLTSLNILLTFDRGFLDQAEMFKYRKENTDFLVCGKMNLKLIEEVKNEVMTELKSASNYLYGLGFYGVCRKKLLKIGKESVEIFVHVYFKGSWADCEIESLMNKIEAYKLAHDQGTVHKLTETEREVKEFFLPLEAGKPAMLDIEKINKHCSENCGYFALVSSNINDPATAAKLYGLRNSSEICFKLEKSLDRKTARSHSDTTFTGKDFTTFVATMLASTVLKRLSSWKNNRQSSKEVQPLNRNHDYKDFLKIVSGIRIQREVKSKAPWFVNAGGKAVDLLKVLDLSTNWNNTQNFMNLLTLPPKLTKDACLAAGWIR